jgi:hypothetical protein
MSQTQESEMDRIETERPQGAAEAERNGSNVATHRKAERMKTYVPHPRPEGRM